MVKAAFDHHADFYIYKRYCKDKTHTLKRAWFSNAALTKIELFLPFLGDILDYLNTEFRNKIPQYKFLASLNQTYRDELWLNTINCVKCISNGKIYSYTDLIFIKIHCMVIKSTSPWVGI